MSDSEEDEGEGADGEAEARDAAVAAAELDGATVERVTTGSAAGTPHHTREQCQPLSQLGTGALSSISVSTAQGRVTSLPDLALQT